jgi:hypothetical protein
MGLRGGDLIGWASRIRLPAVRRLPAVCLRLLRPAVPCTRPEIADSRHYFGDISTHQLYFSPRLAGHTPVSGVLQSKEASGAMQNAPPRAVTARTRSHQHVGDACALGPVEIGWVDTNCTRVGPSASADALPGLGRGFPRPPGLGLPARARGWGCRARLGLGLPAPGGGGVAGARRGWGCRRGPGLGLPRPAGVGLPRAPGAGVAGAGRSGRLAGDDRRLRGGHLRVLAVA